MQQTTTNNDISKLPPEILAFIFDKLTPKELLTAARVCKLWNNVSSDNVVWKTKIDFADTKDFLPTHSFFYKTFYKENNPFSQIRKEIQERIALSQINNTPEHFSSPLTCLKKLEDLVKQKIWLELPNHENIKDLTIVGCNSTTGHHPTVLELATLLGLPKTVSFLLKVGHTFPAFKSVTLAHAFNGLLQSYVDYKNNAVVNRNYFEVIKMIHEKFYTGEHNDPRLNMIQYFIFRFRYSNAFFNRSHLAYSYSHDTAQIGTELLEAFRQFLFDPQLKAENNLKQ